MSTFCLTGCIVLMPLPPIPFPYRRAPDVDGVLLQGDAPVPGATVWWAGPDPAECSLEDSSVRTSTEGAFRLKGSRGLVWQWPFGQMECGTRITDICVLPRDREVVQIRLAESYRREIVNLLGLMCAGVPSWVSANCDLDEAGDGCTIIDSRW